MLIESKIRAEVESIWATAGTPIRKARKFLSLSQRLAALARHFANLGFHARREDEAAARKRFWTSAANLLHQAQQARECARYALIEKAPGLGFNYGPQAYATPNWSTSRERVPSPFEVTP